MEKFNGDQPLKKEIIQDLEEFFEYRWVHNKNNAISTQEDEDLLA